MARGDAEFEDWYGREQPRMLASMMVASGDSELAQEVTAEAFARALERWDRVGMMDSPGGWTYQVALNVLKRMRRRRTVEQALLRRQRDEGASLVDAPHFDVELWEAVRELPERMRTAVALRYVADLTERQVAETMGIASGTVAATLNHARGRLAERLGDRREVGRD